MPPVVKAALKNDPSSNAAEALAAAEHTRTAVTCQKFRLLNAVSSAPRAPCLVTISIANICTLFILDICTLDLNRRIYITTQKTCMGIYIKPDSI
jgi:hypothetical protein